MTQTVVNRLDMPALAAATGPKGQSLGQRLDLVEQVKVQLSVTLGDAEVTMARLFALAAGDVVALDRQVDAPVDVRLHGKLIARGTLVAVGDKFGIRVTEIATPG
ncbi:MAG TPA: FliM/FliN family flagellar motor switch protein [Steroidobacteraceae bacterium]|nr:FliM/FliN family flagellar motor switch protein [Steroidobacteraceae bacterium]